MDPDTHPYQAMFEPMVENTETGEPLPLSDHDIAMRALRGVAMDPNSDSHVRLRAAELLLSQ